MSNRKYERLTLLSRAGADAPSSPNEAKLEAFDNTHPQRDYTVTFECPEFTSLCPVTAQPDFGHIRIEYIPSRLCLESKSLKLYLFSFRNHPSFHEEVVNTILDAMVAAIAPREATVTGRFRPRGGIAIHVTARYPGS